MRICCLARSLVLFGMLTLESGARDQIKIGSGSYTTKRPEGCEPLPKEISKVNSLKGATPTNQWWSSLVWETHSQNLFPHPLAMVCHEEGMAVTYPGAGIDGRSGNIMGGGVSKGGDFVIGHSATKEFPDTRLGGFSAWMITTEARNGEAVMKLSFGHGSPFVFGRIEGGNAILRFAHKPIVWSGTQEDAIMGITVRGNHYGLFGATGSKWKGSDAIFENEGSKGYFSVALLPDQKPETLKMFAACAHNHVVTTGVSSKHENGRLVTTYQWETEGLEGQGEGSIFALYPHQWKYSSASLTGQSYRSVRGEMKVMKGGSFQTTVPIQGLLPMFPGEGIPDVERMRAYLKAEAKIEKKDFGDTYWEGKHLGKLATLSGIAEVMGEDGLQKKFVGEIRTRLENWFTAGEGEKAPLFYYDSNWGSLIGSRPSYGSDSQINDHHFHYGYFIRAAAEVARHDPEWAEKWGPMVNLLIRDIASPEKNDPLFPHLRCFDIYAGHSWASGHAKFGDGNNQESSSESMNAWYGMMLWGEVTGDLSTRNQGLYLYNTERTAVEEYWFDVSGTNFPKDFPNVALGMIWGGKGAFATWFSGDIDCIHGINWLPFTPASIYMGRFPDYVKKNHDRIVEKREKGADYNNGWGDLVAMFGALNDPTVAIKYLDENPDCSLEGGNTHAFMYHWLNTLGRYGRNEASVTADHPYVNVFTKGGKKSYVVYNFRDEALTVNFSDGEKVVAKSRGLTVKSD